MEDVVAKRFGTVGGTTNWTAPSAPCASTRSRSSKAVLATASKPGRNGESALIPANPCMIPTPGQKRETETVPATVDQVKAIHDNMPARYADTIYIAVFCNGPRIGEICTLQRRDIDLEHLILHIRRSRKTIGPQTAMRYQHSVSGRAQDLAKRIGSLIPTPDTIQTLRQRIQTNNDEIQRLQEENRQLEQRIAALADSDGVSSM